MAANLTADRLRRRIKGLEAELAKERAARERRQDAIQLLRLKGDALATALVAVAGERASELVAQWEEALSATGREHGRET